MPDRETPVEVRTTPQAPGVRGAELPAGKRASKDQARRILVIGTAADLPRALAHRAVVNGQFSVVGTIAIEVESPDDGILALNGAVDQMRSGGIDTFLIAGEIGPSTMRRVTDLALAYHCAVLAVMPTEVLEEHEPVVVWSGDGALIQLARLPRHPVDAAVKRAIDVVGASMGLLLSAPVLVVLAALIKLESPGAFLFRHERVGCRGKKFSCLKLRTMRHDAEDVLRADATMYEAYRQNHYKLPDHTDPRVTRIGRFLRRTSLDELPQLWNVLVGEMSLVGPRPVVEAELEKYGHDRDLMLSVKPGLTGAWAVNGRQSVGYPMRCEIELRYVRERTFVTDMRIVLRTAVVVFGADKGPLSE